MNEKDKETVTEGGTETTSGVPDAAEPESPAGDQAAVREVDAGGGGRERGQRASAGEAAFDPIQELIRTKQAEIERLRKRLKAQIERRKRLETERAKPPENPEKPAPEAKKSDTMEVTASGKVLRLLGRSKR